MIKRARLRRDVSVTEQHIEESAHVFSSPPPGFKRRSGSPEWSVGIRNTATHDGIVFRSFGGGKSKRAEITWVRGANAHEIAIALRDLIAELIRIDD